MYSLKSPYQNFVLQTLLFWGSVLFATRTQQAKIKPGENDLTKNHFTHTHTHTHKTFKYKYNFHSVQLLSHFRLFATSWTAACEATLSITNSQSLLKLMSIESVMPSNHLIPCRPLLLLPPIPSSMRVFSNESVLHIR